MHQAMNGDIAGFFDIGMVLRNEANAIIVHGTMCLIRTAALESTGGWSSDTICEDTDLGLTLLEAGWLAHYTDRRYGYGLLPDLRRLQEAAPPLGLWRLADPEEALAALAPRHDPADARSEARIAIGWLNWLGAESLGVPVALLNLAWVPAVAFLGIAMPDRILTLPIIASFAVSLFTSSRSTGCPCAAARPLVGWCSPPCRCSGRWRARSLRPDSRHLPFVRTAKGGLRRRAISRRSGKASSPAC